MLSRRAFLASSFAASASASARRYHLCLSPDAMEADPELLGLVRQAGVTDIWLAGFFYGRWYNSPERIARTMRMLERAGIEPHVASVPLGHPGDSLGRRVDHPPHWKPGIRSDGGAQWGTSLHAPATEENTAALARLAPLGVRDVFLDDDFRLARGPGVIGGCFCDAHIEAFRRLHGYAAGVKAELVDAISKRDLTGVLRAWIDYTCDQLSACFRAIQRAAPRVELGIMVMYLGAEKAGIRLRDYRGVPFRVGESMFGDRSFQPVKGKTDELFSALFHRRFTEPHRAYSETTAFPADKLSAANMAAKLAVSTLGDVRHTMFMSGLLPFPRTHWQTLAPAMREHARIHARVAGHTPRGPFKHYWGERGRYVSDDKPSSLFLASGVPFEVVDSPSRDGFVFGEPGDTPATLPDLFALKRRILPQLAAVPYVEDDKPVVCSWLPTARTVLLWNLSETREEFSLLYRGARRHVTVEPLGLAEVSELA